jgi:hypothetical protein
MDYADHEVASLRRSSTGIIAAIMMWHHYADLQVARLRRSWNGSIAPIINMLRIEEKSRMTEGQI